MQKTTRPSLTRRERRWINIDGSTAACMVKHRKRSELPQFAETVHSETYCELLARLRLEIPLFCGALEEGVALSSTIADRELFVKILDFFSLFFLPRNGVPRNL